MIVGFLCRWTAAAFWSRRGSDVGLRTDVLGDEVGMLTKAIARALDLDDDGMVKEPVE